jgi:peptidoglycan/LPS O-acetylase OafA/YrhL
MNKSNRIDYLDSVRGIAAMMVVVYHYIGWRWADKLSTKLLKCFLMVAMLSHSFLF